MSWCWFVTDELHIQWEVILESETSTSSAFIEKHECPPTSGVETAADHQVDISVICCVCDVAATAHSLLQIIWFGSFFSPSVLNVCLSWPFFHVDVDCLLVVIMWRLIVNKHWTIQHSLGLTLTSQTEPTQSMSTIPSQRLPTSAAACHRGRSLVQKHSSPTLKMLTVFSWHSN